VLHHALAHKTVMDALMEFWVLHGVPLHVVF
jgi:hypothetical protein